MIVAITGARGRIGSILMERLAGAFELRPVTRMPGLPGGRVADVSDIGAIERALAGCDAVVHLAGTARVEADWEDVLRHDIVGTFNVFEAARRQGVGRVVFASTNHVVGTFETSADERLYELTDPRVLDHASEIQPDSLYGAGKAFGEALGRYYVDHHGLACICLRIGSVVDAPDPGPGVPHGTDVWSVSDPVARLRLRATWLSHRDCGELVLRALLAPCRWAIVFGTSGNPRRLWDLEHARSAIGYVPGDAAPRLMPGVDLPDEE